MYFISLQSFFPHWLIQILFYRKWHQSCWVIRIYIFFTPPSIYFQFSGHGSTLKTVLKYTITFIIHINVSTIDEGVKNSIQKFLHITVTLWKVTELLIRGQKIKMDHHVFISFLFELDLMRISNCFVNGHSVAAIHFCFFEQDPKRKMIII